MCAATGIAAHLLGLPGALELVTYAAMGWMVTPFLPTLVDNMHPTGLRLVLAGGCIYTSGIYFFVTGGCVRVAAWTASGRTAMRKLRIARLGFGTW